MDNESLDLDFSNQSNERPQLLTVACVLSWIMAGLMIFCGVLLFLMKSAILEGIAKASAEMDAEQLQAIDVFLENYDLVAYLFLIPYLISVLAVYMMYTMKKVGFYIYAPLHVFIMFSGALYGEIRFDMGMIFPLAILIGFIAMYAVNLKHMK